MSQDIRSYFLNSKQSLEKKITKNERCEENVISDYEEIHNNLIKNKIKEKKHDIKSHFKKRTISSDEDETDVFNKKKKKVQTESLCSKNLEEFLDTSDISEEFLNKQPVKRLNAVKINKYRKKVNKMPTLKCRADFISKYDDFDATLNQLDTSQIEDEYLSTIKSESCLKFGKKNCECLNCKNGSCSNYQINENNKEKKILNFNEKISDIYYNDIVKKKVEQKIHNSILYRNYLNRGGAKNPGSKEIPQGADQCLVNLNFLITGVLESLERNEAEKIIKQYGGKILHSVSKKLNYIIIGDEPGPSKLAKAESLGIKKITEDDLLDLIRTRPLGLETIQLSINSVDKTKDKKLCSSNCSENENNTDIKNKKNLSLKNTIGNVKTLEVNVDCLISNCILERSEKPIKTKNLSPKDESNTIAISTKCFEVETEVKKEELLRQYRINKSNKMEIENKNVIDLPLISQKFINTQESNLNYITALVEKYRPKELKQIIGQNSEKSNAKKLLYWLTNWNKNYVKNSKTSKLKYSSQDDMGKIYKAVLLSGPPGIGKTTTAYVVCAQLGYEILEFNASNTRSKKLLQEEISAILFNKTIKTYFKNTSKKNEIIPKHVLLMDEVDGMAGNEDYGGIQELIALIKSTEVPIICICNERNNQKMKTLANYTFDLRFQKPRLEQIRAAMMSLCFKESIKVKPEELTLIIQSTNQDIRQVINHIAILSVNTQIVNENTEKTKYKNLKLGPWDIVRKTFSSEEHKIMSIHDKSDLFFHDYNIAALFVEENYLIVTPNGSKKQLHEKLANCTESLAIGDTIENNIKVNQTWNLLPVQACFSSVIPGSIMSGFFNRQINFPSWFGKNSKRVKYDRLLQDITIRTRKITGASKEAINLDYLKMLVDSIIRPMIIEGIEGVYQAVNIMNKYNLTKENLDSLIELTKWPHTKDPMQYIDSKTKSAFTKMYNKSTLFYSSHKIKKKSVPDDLTEDYFKSDEEVSDDTDDKIENDKLVKTKITKTKNIKSNRKTKTKNTKKY
ncbi:PREDICTED: replication factor C subunit 1 [Ceratosolen solmsi marchali]|uniref:Replication factor C subunit 1 n=1 Tax=Ceratosolen solmsi marchali TaxID=326594 RepID=A0AAJ7DUU3_9HYME|nr:PREDICTED: replication factor C subunit 1 [Ceratosolen solmsi marchali]